MGALRDDADVARVVKARIDITTLGSICAWMQQVVRPSKAYVECKLDLRRMGRLHLQLTNRDIAEIVSEPKNLTAILPRIKGYRLLKTDIRVAIKDDDLIRVQPRGER